MKKTLSLILALLMSLSTASVAFADEAAVIAEDVEATAVIEETVEEEETVAGPYDEALTYLKHYHIINGLGDGELGADLDVQRYQMALFVSRISTGWTDDSAWENSNYTPYVDLEGTYAASVTGALTYADENGIIKGVGDNRFAPEAQVTYQDALTMAVRTLGYKTPNYPWGFITKAIELGLTEGIEDVAYTAPIKRGVAAQIIYNALMAEMKEGGTLAGKNFNEFGWETVVITATSKDVLVDAKKAAAGFVGFQIVEDGELAETVYYADAAYFGLDATAYEDVLAIGASYDVLFEMNEDGLTNIVDIIDVKSNYVETLWNAEGETEIAGDYTLVSEYSKTSNWLGTDAGKELKVVNALGGIYELVDSGDRIGIDFATDDIVIYETKTAKDENGKEYTYAEITETLWWYNDVIDAYYTVVIKENGEEIGIKYMDAEDEADLRDYIESVKLTKKWTEKKGFGTVIAPDKVEKNSAYASLDVFEVEGKYYGIFEEYRFGKFTTGKTGTICDHNKELASYVLSDVYSMATTLDVLGDTAWGTRYNVALALAKNNGCDTCKNYATAWINPNFAANVTEDGEVLEGYVVYSADEQTGEIKIIKYIGEVGTEYATEDDYIDRGMVRAYDVTKETVRINGVDYTFNYDTLAGNALINVTKDGSAKYMKEYSDNLRDWFNQYVEIVVLDGEIVYMNIVPVDTTERYFVVERYAGVSSDGYLVADGYQINANGVKTLTSVRISTVNNAYTGDLFYYLTEKKVDATFGKGTIYYVSSTDETGALNVQLAYEDGELSDWVDGEVADYVVDADTEDARKLLADKGKILLGGKREDNSTRTYILIDTEEDTLVVYEGKLAAGDYVKGTKLNIGGAIVIVDATELKGFTKATDASGLVALVNDRYWSASFDGAYAGEDWYLLGASEYTVQVFDFVACEYVTVPARNLDLDEGYIYTLTGGQLVYDDKDHTYTAGTSTKKDDKYVVATETISSTLAEELVGYAFGEITLSTEYNDKDELVGFTKTGTSVEGKIAKEQYAAMGYSKDWDDIVIVDDVALITLGTTKKGDVIITDIEDDFSASDLAKLNEKADVVTVKGFYMINLDDGHAKIYVFKKDVASATSAKDATISATNAIEAGTDAYITATATVDTATDAKGVTTASIDSVTFSYTGKATEDTHFNVGLKGYTFGLAGEHTAEAWDTTINDKPVYGTIVPETGMYCDHDDEDADICDLIQTVTVEFDAVALSSTTWTWITVEFNGNKGASVPYVLTVAALIEADGSISFCFDELAADHGKDECSIGGEVVTEFIAVKNIK